MSAVSRRPNVLLVMSDQHRRDHAGCYGHPLVKTQAIDGLAAQGVTFDRAYCPSPICGPCRSAVMSGQHVHRNGALTHGMFPGAPAPRVTLGTIFRDAGYATGAFGKVHVAGETDEEDIGFTERALRIYTHTKHHYKHVVGDDLVYEYANYLYGDRPQRNSYNPTNEPLNMPEDKVLDRLVADRTNQFLHEHRDEPFFAWVGFEKPHTDFYAPAKYHAMYNPDDFVIPHDIWESREHLPSCIKDNPQFPIVTREPYTDHMLRCCMAAYAAQVTYMDDQLASVLSTLRDLELDENTIVIYCSDHGENLFNHGLVHKHCFYEQAVGVPLLIRFPGRVPSNQRRDHLVNLIDLFPTLIEWCGLPSQSHLDGRSLIDIIDTPDEATRDAVFSEYYSGGTPERMIRTDQWKYVHSYNDTPQLYDLSIDPGENRNLATDSAHADICHQLDEHVMAEWCLPQATYPHP